MPRKPAGGTRFFTGRGAAIGIEAGVARFGLLIDFSLRGFFGGTHFVLGEQGHFFLKGAVLAKHGLWFRQEAIHDFTQKRGPHGLDLGQAVATHDGVGNTAIGQQRFLDFAI